MKIQANFWERVDVKSPQECWEWKGPLNNNGYGQHRKAYQLAVGTIPFHSVIMHLCNNRRCCNPLHLKAGTPSENVRYMHTSGAFNPQQVSISCRNSLNGTGIQYDKRAKTYNIMFKVLGKPLYIQSCRDPGIAKELGKAALDETNKLLRTRQGITYEQIKEHFCG